MAANDWKFKQLEAPFREITLSDYAAPFGRPRQKPVVTEKLMTRNQVTRYPGNSGAPTRHLFGVHREDQELSGRWMDSKLGVGFSATLVRQFDNFIHDQVRCRITWGNISSWIAVVESIEVAWESPTQVAWKLHLLIDEKDGDNFSSRSQRTLGPDTVAAMLEQSALMIANLEEISTSRPDFSPDFLDKLDDVISLLSVPSAELNKIAGKIDSIERMAAGDLQRVRMAAASISTSLVGIENTLASAVNDSALIVRQSETDIEFYSKRSRNDLYADELLSIIADLDRALKLSEQQGATLRHFVARRDDTWESISSASYGSPSKAAQIRKANGIKFGALPQSGVSYTIPA